MKKFREMNKKTINRIEWKIQQMKSYECELSIILEEPLDSLMQRLIIETVEHNHRKVKEIISVPNSLNGIIIKLENGFIE